MAEEQTQAPAPDESAAPDLIQIKERWTGAVIFEIAAVAELTGAKFGARIGFAARKAIEDRASLTGANLTDANLTGANLTGARLRGADLKSWNLTKARRLAAGPALRDALATVVALLPESGDEAVVAARKLLEQVP